jgi:hypothetical protein
MRAQATRASPLPLPANEAIYWLAFAQKIRARHACEQHSRARNRSSEKDCRQISARWQTNLTQLCDAANSCGDAARDSLLRIDCSASLHASTTLMEVRRVDLGLKLNVLAVCAAFVFVGAILLGAF